MGTRHARGANGSAGRPGGAERVYSVLWQLSAAPEGAGGTGGIEVPPISLRMEARRTSGSLDVVELSHAFRIPQRDEGERSADFAHPAHYRLAASASS